MDEQRAHIATLDALRGVAAVAVVIYHLTQQTSLGQFPPHSHLAVDFFFVLSGFVIARTYEFRLNANMSIWAFARIRLIRLYPLIFLGTVLGFAAKIGAYFYFPSAQSGIQSLSVIFEALLFGLFLIPNKGMYAVPDARMFELDSPVWSLMFEIWVNIVYGVVVRILTIPILWLIVAAGAIGVTISAFNHHDLNGGYSLSTFVIGIARVWFSFFAGVLIHRLVPANARALLPRVPALVLAIVLVLSFMPSASWSGAWYEVGIVLIVYPAIVVLSISDPISPRWRSMALLAGALSYPVYILHWPTLTHFAHFRSLHVPILFAFLALALLGTLVVSYIASRWYDEPIRKWLNKQYSRGDVRPLLAAEAGPPKAQ